MFDDAAIRAIHGAAARKDQGYPHALWAPIPEFSTQGYHDVTSTLIFHSMAGPRLTSLEALRIYVSREDIKEEPSFAGPDFDGRLFQVVEWDQIAHCNYRANPFAVSFETQDNGAATLASTPWSPAQVEQLAGAAAFGHLRDGIPLAPPRLWHSGGVGYHSQFAEWSNVAGKTCPGAARIAQMPTVLARAVEIVNWREPAPIDEEDDEMAHPFVAVYTPGPAVQAARPNAKWFVLLRDGSVRHLTGPDDKVAKREGVPYETIDGPEHYDQLDHLSKVNEPV